MGAEKQHGLTACSSSSSSMQTVRNSTHLISGIQVCFVAKLPGQPETTPLEWNAIKSYSVDWRQGKVSAPVVTTNTHFWSFIKDWLTCCVGQIDQRVAYPLHNHSSTRESTCFLACLPAPWADPWVQRALVVALLLASDGAWLTAPGRIS